MHTCLAGAVSLSKAHPVPPLQAPAPLPPPSPDPRPAPFSLHSRLWWTFSHSCTRLFPGTSAGLLTFPSPGQHSPAHSLLDSCLSLLAPGRPSPAASETVPPLTFYTFCSLHRLLGCTSVSFPDTFGFCPCEGTAPATSSRFSLSVERRPYAHPLLVCHALSSPRSSLCPLHTLPTPPHSSQAFLSSLYPSILHEDLSPLPKKHPSVSLRNFFSVQHGCPFPARFLLPSFLGLGNFQPPLPLGSPLSYCG